MGAADLIEWLGVLVSIPIALAVYAFLLITLLYVFFDSQRRSRSKVFAAIITLAVGVCYWPLSFFAYLACIAILDYAPHRAASE